MKFARVLFVLLAFSVVLLGCTQATPPASQPALTVTPSATFVSTASVGSTPYGPSATMAVAGRPMEGDAQGNSNGPGGVQNDVQDNRPPWEFDGTDWRANGHAPACPNPFFVRTPVPLKLVTSILYPGQTRGGDYKAHGGFRFDNSTFDAVQFVAPFDGYVVRGARYLVNGTVQYTFDVINACGIMYRVGHLAALSPQFKTMADSFPPAQEMDSRTTNLKPTLIPAGTVIGTALGFTGNVFVDWGVFDLRQRNAAAQNAEWAAQHSPELAAHAVCWFDWLSPADEATVRNLPAADGASGKQSDFCK